MVFSVVDNESSQNPLTRVEPFDMAGNELWISNALNGIASGDPLFSSDGSYIFLIHNIEVEEDTNGFFTMLDANSTGIVSCFRQFDGLDPNAFEFGTVAFGPPGICHDPIRGAILTQSTLDRR
mmetsp:Transcript_16712/g.38342  ORF Transcript_16712/g.38342 Transcript_16712/m.38342 type:complete len:123 (+) Transcript_16712:236-604(+)